jgi:Tol biopolymer transport system component
MSAPKTPVFLTLLLLMSSAPSFGASLELASRAEPGLFTGTGAGDSSSAAISDDGRYVAFVSEAVNLVPGQVDHNLATDVFLRDRVAGTTVLVSHASGAPAATGDARSGHPGISANGRYVIFRSEASNLVPGQVDTTSWTSDDLFLYDRETGTTRLITHKSSSSTTSVGSNTERALTTARRSW